MARKIAVLLTIILAFGLLSGCEGPEGPVGPPGPKGEPGDITILEDTLLVGDLISGDEIGSDFDFWEIDTGAPLDDALFTVHVRPGQDYTWFEPTWDFVDRYIYLYNDDMVEPGYEFRIAIVE